MMKCIVKFLRKRGLLKLKASILVVGLARSGKTSIVHALSRQALEDVAVTVGFNVEQFRYHHAKLKVFDMAGGTKYQTLWSHYYGDSQAIVFVVDSADPAALPEARGVLEAVLADPRNQGKPVLLFLNKQDLAGALSPLEVAQALALGTRPGALFCLQPCSAITSQGLEDGMKWVFGRVRALL